MFRGAAVKSPQIGRARRELVKITNRIRSRAMEPIGDQASRSCDTAQDLADAQGHDQPERVGVEAPIVSGRRTRTGGLPLERSIGRTSIRAITSRRRQRARDAGRLALRKNPITLSLEVLKNQTLPQPT